MGDLHFLKKIHFFYLPREFVLRLADKLVGTGGSIDSFRFFFAMLPMKSSLHWINALFAPYMMVSFAREEVFASLQYFKHVKSHSNQHSHDIL